MFISLHVIFSIMRFTSTINIPNNGMGTHQSVVIHEFTPQGSVQFNPNSDSLTLEDFKIDRAYIQASLHCDELPGMLVVHHLLKMLQQADAENAILKPIMVLPYANPIGLNQILLNSHLGRFSLASGTNFNRDWPDVSDAVVEKVQGQLSADDPLHNVATLRRALLQAIRDSKALLIDKALKKELFQRAAIASVVLDLHCDADAVMHLYTHDRLWPQYADLAALLDSKCNLLAPNSGGDPFDEACSCPWAVFADAHPTVPIPMACQSTTVELRGESDVYDDLAVKDATAIFFFLVHRGYISSSSSSSLLPQLSPILAQRLLPASLETEVVGTPLTGVDMIAAPVAGVIAFKVRAGDLVEEGQLLGEIVNIEDFEAPRTPFRARNSGIVYGMSRHKLAFPGDIMLKVAGSQPLAWRTGNLLTAK